MTTALDRYFAPAVAALDLRSARGQALASNVANADTPGYKARDFDFSASLGRALARGTPLQPVRTDAAHLLPASAASSTPPLLYRVPVQPSIDGNTVELDSELAAFSDNSLRFEADLTFLNGQMRLMSSAVTG